MGMLSTTSTRRTFLKGAALSAAAALGAGLTLDGAATLAEADEGPAQEKWVKTFCGTCIFTNCGMEVKVVNGVATEIRGNKDHPANQGTMCPRGAAQLMNLYDPYRCKVPVKRTNPEKGLDVDPQWQEIPLEEAKEIIFTKMEECYAKDPRRHMFMYGFGDTLHEGPYQKTYTAIMGTPNYAMSCGPLCEVHHAPQLFNNTFIDRVDVGHCNYLITLGRNMGASAAFASGPSRAMADAWKRGMKTVVVDPHCNVEASHGEWLPIRPGGDMAFCMAMINVLLHELNVYDGPYLRERTNLPYLIQEDQDYYRNPETGKPMMWDAAEGVAKDYDAEFGEVALEGAYTVNGTPVETAFEKIKASVKDTTPEWAEGKTGISAEDIRRVTTEFAEAAQIGSTIVIDGVEMPYRPVCLAAGRGSANTMQGQRTYIVADTVNMLVGALGVPGSLIHVEHPKFEVEDGVILPEKLTTYLEKYDAGFTIPFNDMTGKQFSALARFPVLTTAMGAIVDPAKYFVDYDIDVLFPIGSNGFMADTDRDLFVQAYKKVPFIFTTGLLMDECSLFCDVILPEHSSLERQQIHPIEEIMTAGVDSLRVGGVNYKESPVEHVYDTVQFEEFVMELAYRLGRGPQLNMTTSGFFGLMGTPYQLDPTKRYTYAEVLDRYLKATTKDDGKGIDWFRENGFWTFERPVEDCYDYCIQGAGRLPVYDHRDLMVGRHLKANCEKWGVEQPGWEGRMDEVYAEYTPVPEWHENSLTASTDDGFDLYCVNWKISPRILGLGGADNNVWLREVVENHEFDDLCIQINPLAAEARGLKTGDKVLVESQFGGTAEGVVKVTGLIREDCLGFPAQGGHVSKFLNPAAQRGTNYNQLLSAKDGDYFTVSGSISIASRVKIRKAE
ncbi:molybdopterin-dependent oxidoreductase [Adlercreutzia faecimuris]|uniref:Molybdopterin-dependent oxidoreductase n=1 Tax=Adlercreutzia faecimuris TaxID=2897341 RepID=A0ABS9WH65_9ACTN|nr:molybdopterin-dependent oxidoreductase [Adlercreutzia sp. JBNU-10]MCI2242209.1 molybdopterin-dependent oxidoreductase [Adlercreutzia sp. JBNU-10]